MAARKRPFGGRKPFEKLTIAEKLRILSGERRFPTPFGSMQFKSMVDRRAVAVEQFEKLLAVVAKSLREQRVKKAFKDPRWRGFTIKWKDVDPRFPIIIYLTRKLKQHRGRYAGMHYWPGRKTPHHRIAIFLLDEQDRGKITPEEFYERLKRYKDTFVHEFTHYQDAMRFGTAFFEDREDHSYRSRRCELNAYYQEGAEQLVPTILRMARGEGLRSLHMKKHYPASWRRGAENARRNDRRTAERWLQKDRKKAWQSFEQFLPDFWNYFSFLSKLDERPQLKAWFEKAARRDFNYACKVVRQELEFDPPPPMAPSRPRRVTSYVRKKNPWEGPVQSPWW